MARRRRRKKKNPTTAQLVVLIAGGVIGLGLVGTGIYFAVRKPPGLPPEGGLGGGIGEVYTYTIVDRPGGKFAAMVSFPGGGGTAMSDTTSREAAVTSALAYIEAQGGTPREG